MEALLSAALVALAEPGGDGTKLPMTAVSLVVLALSFGLTGAWIWYLYR